MCRNNCSDKGKVQPKANISYKIVQIKLNKILQTNK